MLALHMILWAIFALLALAAIGFALRRAIGNNRRWRVMEPQLVAGLEKRLGQKIVCTRMLNASEGPAFSRDRIFWFWLAFTSDYLLLAARDALARNGEGEVLISKRSDASLRRIDKHSVELAFTEEKTGRQATFAVLARPRDFDLLNRYVRRQSD